jgi:glycosyltransferase involved in cell wall biosynthesis
VFASPVGGIEDYLVDGVNGFQIEQNADDLVIKINNAFSDPAAMQRMSDGARATALNYGWDHVGAKYIELLEQVQQSKQQSLAAPAPAAS